MVPKQTMMKYVYGCIGAFLAGIVLVVGSTQVIYPAIGAIAGLAVSQTSTLWNNVIDAARGDAQQTGILGTGLYLFNGVTFDRVRGDAANGMDVDITRMPASIGVQPVQGATLLNSTIQIGSANAVLTIVLSGVANQRIHLYAVPFVTCTPSGAAAFTILDNVTTIYSFGGVSANPAYTETFNPGLTASTGSSMTLNLTACGAGNSGVIAYQADQF